MRVKNILESAYRHGMKGNFNRVHRLIDAHGISPATYYKYVAKKVYESTELEESLELSKASLLKDKDGQRSLKVIINGIEYRYRPVGMDMDTLVRKFMGIYKYGTGRALAWLKKNSTLYYNGRTKQFSEG